jgi:hypothetical protein
MQKPSFTREWSYPFQNPTDVINVRKRNLENSINYFLGLHAPQRQKYFSSLEVIIRVIRNYKRIRVRG